MKATIIWNVLFALALTACNSKTNTNMDETTGSAMVDSTTNAVNGADSDFAMKAAAGGKMEVELGNLAQQNAQNQRVKDFGAMMVRDHTNANNQLKSIASAKNIMLPDSLPAHQQKMVNDLKTKKGKDFDQAYMDMMVSDHNKDIDEFKNEANSGNDPDLKNFAANTLPTLQTHLDSAQQVHKSVKR